MSTVKSPLKINSVFLKPHPLQGPYFNKRNSPSPTKFTIYTPISFSLTSYRPYHQLPQFSLLLKSSHRHNGFCSLIWINLTKTLPTIQTVKTPKQSKKTLKLSKNKVRMNQKVAKRLKAQMRTNCWQSIKVKYKEFSKWQWAMTRKDKSTRPNSRVFFGPMTNWSQKAHSSARVLLRSRNRSTTQPTISDRLEASQAYSINQNQPSSGLLKVLNSFTSKRCRFFRSTGWNLMRKIG